MHRTASVNEYSTRYSEAINLRQETPPDKWRLQSNNNKQGSEKAHSVDYYLSLEEGILHTHAQNVYKKRLESGVAREQARKDLPLSTYTEAYWKIDLHNLLHFLKLRCDSHAQFEIRSYANVIAGMVKEYFPLTFEAWEDYVFNAVTFSQLEMDLFHCYIINIKQGEFTTIESITKLAKDNNIIMSSRELDGFEQKIQLSERHTSFDINPTNAKPYEDFLNK